MQLRELAIAGGGIAMRHHGRLAGVRTKADNTPLTEADLEVDAYLCAELACRFPDIPAITEERSANHDTEPDRRRFFLVDPIDGTKEFVRNGGEFTVNIALVDEASAIAGAVFAPAIGRLFYGAIGTGAFEERGDKQAPRRLLPTPPDNAALRVVASRSHPTPQTDAFIAANRVGQLVNAGSSLKFCLLAAGEADLYPRFGPTMEWDTAAGHAVLAAAGGKVEEISGQPLKYGKPAYKNPSFIAYTPGTKFRRAP